MKTFVIPQRELPAAYEADVVVCGGGTAGVFAAISAAESGKRVLIVEQFGSLGGSATNGLVTPLMHSHIAGDPACSYISLRLREKLKLYGGVDGSGRAFDSTVLKLALEELCAEAGVQLLYHTFISDVLVENGVVKAVVAGNKSGTVVIAGDMFIDCTGDGDVSVLAGAQYAKGNPETGKNQPISLRYVVGGVDIPALGEFFKSELARTGINSGCSYNPPLSVYGACCGDGYTLSDVFKRAIDAGDLTVEDHLYWQMFNIPGRNDCIAFNNPEFFDDTDGTDPDTLTKTQIAGKKAIYRQLAFYKKYMKGFENAYIADIAAMVGIRESRNITTEYVLSAEDLLARRKFDDAFCQSNYPVDIHGKTLDVARRAGGRRPPLLRNPLRLAGRQGLRQPARRRPLPRRGIPRAVLAAHHALLPLRRRGRRHRRRAGAGRQNARARRRRAQGPQNYGGQRRRLRRSVTLRSSHISSRTKPFGSFFNRRKNYFLFSCIFRKSLLTLIVINAILEGGKTDSVLYK